VAVFHGVGGKMVARSGSNQAIAIVETSRQPHPTARGGFVATPFYCMHEIILWCIWIRHVILYILCTDQSRNVVE
jgi:hypothetical protein